jgi:hypothetical protein
MDWWANFSNCPEGAWGEPLQGLSKIFLSLTAKIDRKIFARVRPAALEPA